MLSLHHFDVEQKLTQHVNQPSLDKIKAVEGWVIRHYLLIPQMKTDHLLGGRPKVLGKRRPVSALNNKYD